MDLGLKGKVAIVTGGSRGIGKSTAMALAREGANVVICARGLDVLQETAASIQSSTGCRTLSVQADVINPQDVKRLASIAVAEMGGVDILVNNAVTSVPGAFMQLSDEDWLNHINVKVMGYIRCAREVIPHMVRRGGGRIVNIAGMAARGITHLATSNGVTNAAVANVTKNLADQVAKYGILVNCIHPGPTRTPRHDMLLEFQARDVGATVEEARRRVVQTIPIGRLMETEDIANLIVFLVSDKASAITGQCIAVDGGAGRGVFY